MEELGIPCCIEQFHSGKELLKALGRFDLIFLDILMEGMDGMETARCAGSWLLRQGWSFCPPAADMCSTPGMWRRFPIW